ncbi:hypothetical protein ABZY91_39075, partial [Kitasatospora sp. NPDC002965]
IAIVEELPTPDDADRQADGWSRVDLRVDRLDPARPCNEPGDGPSDEPSDEPGGPPAGGQPTPISPSWR